MLRSGLFSCVRLRRSRLGVLRFAVLSSGRVCSGGRGGVSQVMLSQGTDGRVVAVMSGCRDACYVKIA